MKEVCHLESVYQLHFMEIAMYLWECGSQEGPILYAHARNQASVQGVLKVDAKNPVVGNEGQWLSWVDRETKDAMWGGEYLQVKNTSR